MRGELRRGDRVVPEAIATELGISRIPVREGLIALEREGWVVSERHRGTFVRGIDPQTVRDHHALLGRTFSLIAARAIERADDAQLVQLDTVRRADPPAFLRSLRETAGSTRANAVMRVMPTLLPASAFRQVPRLKTALGNGTALMARAVRARDTDGARSASVALFERVGEQVVRLLGQRGVFVPEVASFPAPAATLALDAFRPAAASGRHDTRSADRVAEHLRSRIIHGTLRPYQRVDPTRIAEEVGLSRTPVREAIIALEREGWVSVEAHRGAFVSAFDETTVEDHYEFCALFFGFACLRIAGRIDGPTRQQLRGANAVLQSAGDAEAFDGANRKFMELLVVLAGSTPLVAVLRATPAFVPGNFFATVPGAMAVQKRGVARVTAATGRGEGAKADRVWADTFRRIARLVLAVL